MNPLEWRELVSSGTHFIGLLLAIPGTLLLWRRSRGDRPKQFSLLVFGFGLICCYTGSTLYHLTAFVRLPPNQVDWFETVDYMGIFILIAGSCTPVAFNLLHGFWRWGTLTMAWTLAAVGMVLRVAYWDVPPWMYTSLYLGMGWSLVVCYFELARLVTHRSMSLIVIGGLLYSIGAAFNVLRWPVFWRGVFGPHELFHLFVLAGSLVHFWFMLKIVVPYKRVPCLWVVTSEGMQEITDCDNSLAHSRASS